MCHKPYWSSMSSLSLLTTSRVTQVAMMARDTMPIICVMMLLSCNLMRAPEESKGSPRKVRWGTHELRLDAALHDGSFPAVLVHRFYKGKAEITSTIHTPKNKPGQKVTHVYSCPAPPTDKKHSAPRTQPPAAWPCAARQR